MEKNEKVEACKDWVARRTANLDQREKLFNALYDARTPEENLALMDDIEAKRFWVDIHRWELDRQLETGSFDEYPRGTRND